jgi:dolichol-phosphate mannosyltransferase
MPVFNEQALVAGTVSAWLRELDGLGVDYRLRIYDDGSTDGTTPLLHALASAEPRLCVTRHDNRGHGPTILRGFREARSPWIFQVDSDGEMSASSFASLWQRRSEYDFLVGARANRRATPPRRLVTALSRACVQVLFGAGIRDVNSPYRLMRRVSLDPLLERLPRDPFAPNVLLSGMAIRMRLRIYETNVPHEGRRSGKGSLTSLRLWRGAARAFCEAMITAISLKR